MLTSSSLTLRGDEVDRLSLLAFKAEIVGDRMAILTSWNESLHFCEWPGISCGRRHQRVTVLDLRSSRLGGQLSPNIGNLSFLRTLNLENNSFNSSIPPEIGRLFRLQRLRLGNNSFRGDIPVSISRCSKLRYLDLGNNILGGKIHNEIGFLSNLQVLNLGKNRLSGEIPPSLGNLSSLQMLSLQQNNLHGANMFTGRVPNLARMSNLFRVEMDANNLGNNEEGDLDFLSSLVNCTNLKRLDISDNKFGGVLPESLSNLSTKLEVMRLGGNQMRGSIPVDIGNLNNLGILGFEANQLTGPIPSSISKLSKLYDLSLNHNELSGNNSWILKFSKRDRRYRPLS
ncbi:LRR receptor-like serine/threonine-protein kinase [Pyrus ussuriensis x Pyrus communis]|uniref:LRR receptor-like serine/threonine-protein kinase n=1 Tax=Pyrus ussuriensis x Pyrus communis TaxID=2448454 RepID=A0A5N5GGG7_9ROSA|nr:LRR receptor-like serine/threonine-protein kinase [Pyrus ussuriensis x Pyrus communis]